MGARLCAGLFFLLSGTDLYPPVAMSSLRQGIPVETGWLLPPVSFFHPGKRGTIAYRSQKNRWRPDLARPRQRQWWRRLGRMIALILGISYSGSPAYAFNLLMNKGFIPVTSAELQENRTM
ncbi:hypothetical protein [Desulfolithobacter dissulfuricans]|uniref:hypothetical protein n=1 Tax=Desulfolithobacter dissulfuricans TaxID=2795293 RepID=UPI0022783EC9|nr:hypothetical protein [Desulfolithobacter dissulfuricans]